MRNEIRIGRISGVSIYIDWSWIFIFLLVTFGLAGGVLFVWHPDWSPWLTWAVAIAASLLLFASVLLHELAHSLVARARGLPVRKITLFLFGGASNIEREPDSPKTEFLMALIGPGVSILLGFIFDEEFAQGHPLGRRNGTVDRLAIHHCRVGNGVRRWRPALCPGRDQWSVVGLHRLVPQ